jgi:polyhydroxyalkanoate synthase subunit PhaC
MGQGHTGFAITWKNPGEADWSVGLGGHPRSGVVAALDPAMAIVPGRRVPACGDCLDGRISARRNAGEMGSAAVI